MFQSKTVTKLHFDDLSNSFDEEIREPSTLLTELDGNVFEIIDKENSPLKLKKDNKKQPQFSFNCLADIRLLTGVLLANPFCVGAASNAWVIVAEKIRVFYPNVSPRRCRERTTLILNEFVKEDNKHLRKSGTEEEYDERSQLLQELKELKAEGENSITTTENKVTTSQKRKKDAEHTARGIELRNEALRSRTPLNTQDVSPETSNPRKAKRDLFQYLCTKHASELEIKKQELALRARELDLREKELELKEKREESERKERAEHFELEKEERKAMLSLINKLIEKNV